MMISFASLPVTYDLGEASHGIVTCTFLGKENLYSFRFGPKTKEVKVTSEQFQAMQKAFALLVGD